MTKDQEKQNHSDDVSLMACINGCAGLKLKQIATTCAIDLTRTQRSVQRLSRKGYIVATSGWRVTKAGKEWLQGQEVPLPAEEQPS